MAQSFPQGGLNLIDRSRSTHGHQQTALLVVSNEGVRLPGVHLEAIANRILRIIAALKNLALPGGAVLRVRRGREFEMKGFTAGFAHSAAREAANHLIVGNFKKYDVVEVLAQFLDERLQSMGLLEVAGEPIEEPAVASIIFLQPVLDQPQDDCEGDQFAAIDIRLCLDTGRGRPGDGSTEDFPCRNVGDSQFIGKARRLGSLTRTGWAEKHEPH